MLFSTCCLRDPEKPTWKSVKGAPQKKDDGTAVDVPGRILSYTFKVTNRCRTMHFFRDILGMKVLRHGEHSEDTESTGEEPTDARWSKTMVGYGPEDKFFAFELIYNYPVHHYDKGNALIYIVIKSSSCLERAKKNGWPILEGNILEAPDGYKFHILDEPEPTDRDPIVAVVLAVSKMRRSLRYWHEMLGMAATRTVSSRDSLQFAYNKTETAVELRQVNHPIQHGDSGGRLSLSLPRKEQHYLENKLDKFGYRILVPIIAFESDLLLLLIQDPDGHELCYYNDKGHKKIAVYSPGDEATLDKMLAIEEENETKDEPAKRVESRKMLESMRKKQMEKSWKQKYTSKLRCRRQTLDDSDEDQPDKCIERKPCNGDNLKKVIKPEPQKEPIGEDKPATRTGSTGIVPIRLESGNLEPIKTESVNSAPTKVETENLSPIREESADLAPVKEESTELVPVKSQSEDLTLTKTKSEDLVPIRTASEDIKPEKTEDAVKHDEDKQELNSREMSVGEEIVAEMLGSKEHFKYKEKHEEKIELEDKEHLENKGTPKSNENPHKKEKFSDKEKYTDKEKHSENEKYVDKERHSDKEKLNDKENHTDKEKRSDKEKYSEKEEYNDKGKHGNKEKIIVKEEKVLEKTSTEENLFGATQKPRSENRSQGNPKSGIVGSGRSSSKEIELSHTEVESRGYVMDKRVSFDDKSDDMASGRITSREMTGGRSNYDDLATMKGKFEQLDRPYDKEQDKREGEGQRRKEHEDESFGKNHVKKNPTEEKAVMALMTSATIAQKDPVKIDSKSDNISDTPTDLNANELYALAKKLTQLKRIGIKKENKFTETNVRRSKKKGKDQKKNETQKEPLNMLGQTEEDGEKSRSSKALRAKQDQKSKEGDQDPPTMSKTGTIPDITATIGKLANIPRVHKPTDIQAKEIPNTAPTNPKNSETSQHIQVRRRARSNAGNDKEMQGKSTWKNHNPTEDSQKPDKPITLTIKYAKLPPRAKIPESEYKTDEGSDQKGADKLKKAKEEMRKTKGTIERSQEKDGNEHLFIGTNVGNKKMMKVEVKTAKHMEKIAQKENKKSARNRHLEKTVLEKSREFVPSPSKRSKKVKKSETEKVKSGKKISDTSKVEKPEHKPQIQKHIKPNSFQNTKPMRFLDLRAIDLPSTGDDDDEDDDEEEDEEEENQARTKLKNIKSPEGENHLRAKLEELQNEESSDEESLSTDSSSGTTSEERFSYTDKAFKSRRSKLIGLPKIIVKTRRLPSTKWYKGNDMRESKNASTCSKNVSPCSRNVSTTESKRSGNETKRIAAKLKSWISQTGSRDASKESWSRTKRDGD